MTVCLKSTGMLASAASIETITQAIEYHKVSTIVVDPVGFFLISSLTF
jgi:Hydroxymethylpyrimidine/phosphomethylpyrimidine kinase